MRLGIQLSSQSFYLELHLLFHKRVLKTWKVLSLGIAFKNTENIYIYNVSGFFINEITKDHTQTISTIEAI